MKITNKATRSILQFLLTGKSLNVSTFFKLYGYSNLSREIIRKLEKPYSIQLDRKRISKKNRFGEVCSYYEYSLNKKDFSKAKRLL